MFEKKFSLPKNSWDLENLFEFLEKIRKISTFGHLNLCVIIPISLSFVVEFCLQLRVETYSKTKMNKIGHVATVSTL